MVTLTLLACPGHSLCAQTKQKSEYNGVEEYVAQMIEDDSIEWFPINRATCLERLRPSARTSQSLSRQGGHASPTIDEESDHEIHTASSASTSAAGAARRAR